MIFEHVCRITKLIQVYCIKINICMYSIVDQADCIFVGLFVHSFLWIFYGLIYRNGAIINLLYICQMGYGKMYGIYGPFDLYRSWHLSVRLAWNGHTAPSVGYISVCILCCSCMLLAYFLVHLYDRHVLSAFLVIIWKPFRSVFALFHRNWEVKTLMPLQLSSFYIINV